jgi:serine/threonine-protein kinase
VLRGLARDYGERFRSAREMAEAIQDAAAPATPHQVGEWVERVADDTLWDRHRMLLEIDRSPPVAEGSSPRASTEQIAGTSLFAPELVDSQISNISVTPLTRPARRSKRRALQIAAVALVAAAIGIGVGASFRASERSESAERAPVPAESTAPPPADLAPAPAPATAAAPEPKPSTAPTKPATAKPTARHKRASATPKDNCDPPFVRDDEGRKIYKRECLR